MSVNQFKKLNELQRLRLKWKDKTSYQDYKFELRMQKVLPFNIEHEYKNETRFKHSGNSGDIIYSLPAVYALCKNKGAHFYLNLHEKIRFDAGFHPLGNVMLNQKMFEMLQPLLLHQPPIEVCDIYTGQPIDYDLDVIRDHPFDLRKNSISRWYFHAFCVFADLSIPWLTVLEDNSLNDHIIIARSHRYRSPNINYSFLKKYKQKVFIGVEEEYKDMKSHLPGLDYLPVKNFLEMASLINGCKLFIGNQSLPFAIAEALKVRRVLELTYQSPNVIVEGKNGYDFYYQPHFEKIVDTIMTEQ